MAFKVVVVGTDDEGEETRDVVHEIEDRRVVKMRVITRRGESATVPIEPDEGDIALTFEYLAAGQLHVSDVEHMKPGYQENQTGEDVQATEEKLEEVRGTANVNESFTQEAVDAAAEAQAVADAGTPEADEDDGEEADSDEEPSYT